MKLKKLYHPQKHYVTIQIPRKGYFYRSYVELRNPGSETSGRPQLSEPRKPKKFPEARISESVPTGSQYSALRARNRVMKKRRKRVAADPEGSGRSASWAEDPLPGVPPEDLEQIARLEALTFGEDFLKRIGSCDFVNEQGESPSQERVNKDERTGSENSKNSPPTFNSRTAKEWAEVENDLLEVIEFLKRGDDEPEPGDPTWSSNARPSATTLESLAGTAPEVIEDDDPRNEDPFFQKMMEEQVSLETRLSDVSEPERSDAASPPEESSKFLSDSDNVFSSNLAAYMTNEIDLHLELQNYLKNIETPHNAKSRTKNTLQFYQLNNYIPIKIHSSGQQSLQCRAEKLSDVGEVKPSPSFNTTASSLPELEETPNEMLLVLNCDPEFKLEEPEPDDSTKTYSESAVPHSDPQKPVAQAAEKALPQITQQQNTKMLDVPLTLFPARAANGINDGYDKISPLSHRYRRKRNGCWSKVPESPSSARTPPNSNLKWSPTLQQLIDIYTTVLKQSNKISKKKPRHVTSVYSFLKARLRPKLGSGTPSGSISKKKQKSVSLSEYVAMFQEILQSSLSIQQIARLNNLVAQLQDYSEKHYHSLMKELRESGESKEIKIEAKKKSRKSKKQSEPAKQTKGVKTESMKKAKPRPILKGGGKQKSREIQNKTQKPKIPSTPPEAPEKVELLSPTSLESVLKMGLASNEIDPLRKKGLTQTKSKLLVTVKLKGNQVLVSNFSYFNNEKALEGGGGKWSKSGTSELIIENVTNNEIWYRNTKSSRLRILRGAASLEKKDVEKNPMKTSTDVIKKPKTKDVHVKKKPKKGNPSKEKLKQRETKRAPFQESFVGESSGLAGSERKFEYDEVQLRFEHPIVDIAEASESKINLEEEILPGEKSKVCLEESSFEECILKMEKMTRSIETSEGGLLPPSTNKTHTSEVVLTKPYGLQKRSKAGFKTGKRKKQKIKGRLTPGMEKKPRIKAKKGKTPTLQRRIYLCYPSVLVSQSKTSKAKMSERKRMVKSRLSSSTSPPSRPSPPENFKDASTDTKTAPTECPDPEPQPSDPAAPPSFPELQRANTILYLNGDVVSDCRSIEFLFSESSEEQEARLNLFLWAPPKTEIFNSLPPPDDPSDQLSIPSEELRENRSRESLNVAFSTDSNSDLFTEIIQSDSFLVNLPAGPGVGSRVQTLINSDIKFIPGRVGEDGREENPLVNFVLTRSQSETANLPPNQVAVVHKEKLVKPSSRSESDEEEKTFDGNNSGYDESHLKAIEEFINQMARWRKEKEKCRAHQTPSSSLKGKAAPRRCRPKTPPPPPNKRVYHECQRRNQATLNKKNPFIEQKKDDEKPLALKKERKEKEEEAKDGEEKIARDEKGEPGVGDGPQPGFQKKMKYTLKGLSIDPSDISPQVLGAVKSAITGAKNIADKGALLAAIDEGFSDRKELKKVDTRKEPGLALSKMKSLKIKVLCFDRKRKEEEDESPPSDEPTGEIQLLDTLVSREREERSVERTYSIYFDAEEVLREDEEKTPPQPTEDAKVAEEKEEKILCDSEAPLEEVFEEISKALEEGRLLHSTTLLERVLMKAEDCSDCARLRKLLALVENKSRNLMMNMEKSAWLKVLSLLDEMTEVLEAENTEESKKDKLKTSKDFIQKIQSLNVRRLTDLEKFCSTFIGSGSNDDSTEASSLVTTNTSGKGGEKEIEEEKRAEISDSPLKIDSTTSLQKIRENQPKKTEKSEAEELRRKLRQQYTCLRELLNTEQQENDLNTAEIEDLREAVGKRIETLEKKFDFRVPGAGSLAPTEAPWKKATSPLHQPRTCRTGEAVLTRRPGYADLVRYLIKAWDTRLTIRSISNECFS